MNEDQEDRIFCRKDLALPVRSGHVRGYGGVGHSTHPHYEGGELVSTGCQRSMIARRGCKIRVINLARQLNANDMPEMALAA